MSDFFGVVYLWILWHLTVGDGAPPSKKHLYPLSPEVLGR